LDVHHVALRSAKRLDTPDNAVALCRPCHRRRDEAFVKGRLVIEALGGECFRMRLVFAQDKWAARAAL
jgi:hypothetical protein